MQKSVIILRGLPGSGKTTFLNFLVAYTHISMDKFWTKDGEEYKFDYHKLSEAIQWTQDQFLKALDAESTLPIVVDNVSYAYEHYRFFVEEAKKRNIPVHIVHIERPLQECRNSHGVPADKVEQMAEKWEPLR
jgi:tRNA uridine 5-carbamoylmethylation protein Kti12